MRTLTIILLSAALAGCGSTYKYSVDAATNTMPGSVRQKCAPVPKELQHGATMGDQTKAYDNLVGLYGECAARDAAKADWIASQGQ